jgi:TRAP-type C4-dicarboxylate transport system substrate-binding protein
MRRLLVVAGLSFALLAMTIGAHAEPIVWQVVNEYPATSIAGEADAFFAEAVKRRTDGRVTVQPIPDAKSGLRSREQLKAVTDGRFAMADTFAGALGEDDPVFLISTLPFVTPTANHARALYEAARPLYEKLFAARGQKLLYVTPWPPSGIWSADPVTSTAALGALKIRTYDTTSTEVFTQVSASASNVSFADVMPKLEAGELNAVLSSGDGGAGRKLWTRLPYFSQITYAIPLSFGSVSLDAWGKLDGVTRAAIEGAARETTDHQWDAMVGRVARNYTVMRENGMTIDEHPPLDVVLALATAGTKSLVEWHLRAGPDAAKVFEDYRGRLPH